MLNLYKAYFEDSSVLNDVDKAMLFRFLQEMIGCVNLQWKEAAYRGARYSEIVTQSNKTMGFFVLKYYGKILSDNNSECIDRKQRMTGKLLDKAILWFNEQSKAMVLLKTSHPERVHELDVELSDYINDRMKWHVNAINDTKDPFCLTKHQQQEELKNLHDFTKLFGKK